MSAQPDDSQPYLDVVARYVNRGWMGVLPLPAGRKVPPPGGFTGGDGPMPDAADQRAWSAKIGSHPFNVALRLTANVIGLDVDHGYPGADGQLKRGADQLAALVERFGPLPTTIGSTSRPNTMSGIRLYRVPPGLAWPSKAAGDIEIIRHGHRYAVVAPSLHPGDRAVDADGEPTLVDVGRPYLWCQVGEDGVLVPIEDQDDAVPFVGHLPQLPPEWVAGLTGGEVQQERAVGAEAATEALRALEETRDVKPCWRVRSAAKSGVEELESPGTRSRHDILRDRIWALIHLYREGHPGAWEGLRRLMEAFARSADRDEREMQGEVQRLVRGALQRVPIPAQLPQDPCAVLEAADKASQDALAPKVRHSPGPAVVGEDAGATTEVRHVTRENLQEADDEATGVRRLELVDADTITPEAVDWLWEERIAMGTLALLAGREGIGKSTVAYDLVGQITRGELPGDRFGQPSTVFISATEDSRKHTIIPRLLAARADLKRVKFVQAVTEVGTHDELSLPKDVKILGEQVRQHDAALILLDPLMSRISGTLDTHRDAEVRQALEPLARIADEYRCGVIGLIHLNKTGTTDPLNAVMGSKAFTALARSVTVVSRDSQNERTRILGTPKNNLGRDDLPLLTYTVESTVVGIDPRNGKEITTGRIVWGESREGSMHDVLSATAGDREEQSERSDAGQFALEYLRQHGGRSAATEVLKAAAGEGFSRHTVQRSLKAYRIDKIKHGFPARVYWQVPGYIEPPSAADERW